MFATMIHPSLKIAGPRDGKEIGFPGIGFVKNRCAGDDICELEVIIEE
jgi:hypothetical protein